MPLGVVDAVHHAATRPKSNKNEEDYQDTGHSSELSLEPGVCRNHKCRGVRELDQTALVLTAILRSRCGS